MSFNAQADMFTLGFPNVPPWLLFTVVIGFFLLAAAYALADRLIDGGDR